MSDRRRIVRLRAGREELYAVETGRKRGKTRGEVDDRTGQHSAEKVRDRPHLPFNGRHYVGMCVAEDGAHLA